ncbi:MAG: HlyD family secretion protein [Methylobacteriaceae bacterium]|nr:HlyD family secretion protein [Methylobacteriaceae bacterium]MBV9247331.1 HlyD family secretion protein [Methylobacteriaceae bacterium]
MPAADKAEKLSADRAKADRGRPGPAEQPALEALDKPSVDRAPAPAPATSDDRIRVLPPPKPRASRRGRLRLLLMVGGILVVGAVSGFMWLQGGRWVSVDDAYVRAAKLMVSTDVSGIVSSVDVHEGQYVKAGDMLFRVDPTQFQIALDSAKAQLAQTELMLRSMQQDYKRMLDDIKTQQSQVALAQATFDRQAALLKTDNVAKANYDQARFSLEAAKNTLSSLEQQAAVQLVKLAGNADAPVTELPQYRQAKAQLDEAQRQLDHTVVRAPFNGIATQVDALRPGTYLVSATAALTNTGAIGLVSTDDIWVEAETKETDLTYAKVGDPVDIYVDTYPGRVWHGRVESISPASGAEFSILPPQNASGNWVKVVQRIPVRISVTREPGDPVLRSGMTVTAEIDTGHKRLISELWGKPQAKEADRGSGGG